MNNTTFTMIPLPGVDYKNDDEVIAAYNNGDDFHLISHCHYRGDFVNITDMGRLGFPINIEYNNRKSIVCVKK